MESNRSRYFNETIYDEMQSSEFTFPTIEFTGYDGKQLQDQLSHIYNKEQVEQVLNKVGKSVYLNHLFVESVIKKFAADGSD